MNVNELDNHHNNVLDVKSKVIEDYKNLIPKPIESSNIHLDNIQKYHRLFGHFKIFEGYLEPYEFDFSILLEAFLKQHTYLRSLIILLTNEMGRDRHRVIIHENSLKKQQKQQQQQEQHQQEDKMDSDNNSNNVYNRDDGDDYYPDYLNITQVNEVVLEMFYTLTKLIINNPKDKLAYIYHYFNTFKNMEGFLITKNDKSLKPISFPISNKYYDNWIYSQPDITFQVLWKIFDTIGLESILEVKYSLEFTYKIGEDYKIVEEFERNQIQPQTPPQSPQQSQIQQSQQSHQVQLEQLSQLSQQDNNHIIDDFSDYLYTPLNSANKTPILSSSNNSIIDTIKNPNPKGLNITFTNYVGLPTKRHKPNKIKPMFDPNSDDEEKGEISPASSEESVDTVRIQGDPNNANYDTWAICKIYLPESIKRQQTSISFYKSASQHQINAASSSTLGGISKKDGKKIQSNYLKKDEFLQLREIFGTQSLESVATREIFPAFIPSKNRIMRLFNTRFQPFPTEASTARYLTSNPIIALTNLNLQNISFELKIDPSNHFHYDKFEYEYFGCGVYRFNISITRTNVDSKRFRLCITLNEKHQYLDKIWTPTLLYCNTTSEFEHPVCYQMELKDNFFHVLGNSFKEGKTGGKPLKVEFTHLDKNTRSVTVEIVERVKVFWIKFANQLVEPGRYSVCFFYDRSKYKKPQPQLQYNYQPLDSIAL